MGIQKGLLGVSKPSTTNATVVYAKPIGARAMIRSIAITNVSTSPLTFRLFWSFGTTYDTTTALFYDVPINNNTTTVLSDLNFDFYGPAGNLAFRTSSANDLLCWVWGEEIN